MKLDLAKVLLFICLGTQTDIWAFRCNNGNEISDFQFCNGYDNCGDRSDESYGCTRRSCRKGKFTCKNDGSCMDVKVRCDGIIDCSDQSDELNCANHTRIEIQPQDCPLYQGKFLCKNKLACLDFSQACDSQCHCLDCSDENIVNCAKLDSESCRSCTQYCLPTPDGPQCICNSTNYESSSLCKEIQSCVQESGCDHHCIRYRNFERCLCYDGHHEIPDTNGHRCQSNFLLETILLYSTVTKIKFINLTSNAIELSIIGVYCTALTATHDYLYYASLSDKGNKGGIYKSLIDHGIPETIVELDSRVTSVAVDWITDNVYFTSNKSLSVCMKNSIEICTQLKCCGINNVVLAPKFGWMFYTQDTVIDDNDQFIMRSNMDGSEEEILLSDESFLSPVSLAFDEYAETLYWLEITEQKLHSVLLDGSNRQIQFLGNEGFSSLAALEKKIYFVKPHNNSFYLSDTLPRFTRYEDDTTSSIRHLYAHSPALQHSYQIENPCAKASCTNLCLIRSSPLDGLNHTCLCENFTPTDDNYWCNKDQEYVVTSEIDSTKDEVHPTTEQSQTTTEQEKIHSSTESSEHTHIPDIISASTNPYETTSENQEDHYSTESTAATNTPEKFNSSTEQNKISTMKKTIYSSSEPSLISTPNGVDYVLIYSTVTKIKAWYLASGEHQVIKNGVDSTALAGSREHLYYATFGDNEGRIFKTSTYPEQTNQLDLLVRMDSRIRSIAVDWITNNVYFTTNVSLSVCSTGGEICAELKCCDTDDVALAPSVGWMFYTKKMTSDDKRIIMKSDMDGSKENILLDESFYQLVSLTVDEPNEKLYWLEMEEQILHSVSFYGNGKQEKSLKDDHHFYKYFAVLEGNFFYTTGHNGFEWQFPLWSRFYEDNSTNSVKFLHAYSPTLQNINMNENPCEFTSCSGLCLLRPGSSSSSCICENFTPTSENHWCNKNNVIPELNSNVIAENKIHTSTESSVKFTLKEVHRSADPSSSSLASPSIVPLKSEYVIASGVIGFILGLITALLIVILICFVFQKRHQRKDRRYLSSVTSEEIEM